MGSLFVLNARVGHTMAEGVGSARFLVFPADLIDNEWTKVLLR